MHPLDLFKYCPKCGSSHFEIHNAKSKKCADCGFVYYFNPSAATVAFILNHKGELLVCRRGKEPAKGTLDLSGGFIDMFESVLASEHVSVFGLSRSYPRPVLFVQSGRRQSGGGEG